MTWQLQLEKAGYPTTALVLDFECFFDKDYSLKKLSTIEYVCDKRFEITGLGYQWFHGLREDWEGQQYFCPPKRIRDYLGESLKAVYGNDLEELTLVGQNLKFDCLILARHFGIVPRYTVDLIDLDRIWDARDKHNLAHMTKKWKAPKFKGDTNLFKGLHWADMDAEKRQQLEEYTKGDIEIESYLFQKLLPLVPNPEIELPLATQTLHMFLKPQIEIDTKAGTELKARMQLEMLKPLEELRDIGLGCSHEEISGNKSFVELLNAELPGNEQVPTKMGKNGMIPALAREDEGMRYLLNHERETVRLLAKARLAIKSWPLHIARIDSLIAQAACSGGKIGAPLKYYAGHLGRWGGTEGINLQNLGGRGRGKPVHPLISQIRQMLKAPDDFLFGIGDYAQIEARILAWLAGQKDLIQGFIEGRDIYSEFGVESFGWQVRKPRDSDPPELHKDLKAKRGFCKDTILGCGYGEGADKFYKKCLANDDLRPLFDSGKYDWNFVDRSIKTYRKRYAKIPEFWRQVEKAWRFVTKYPKEVVDLLQPYYGPAPPKLKFWCEDKATFIGLPSGRFIRYPYATVNKQGDLLYRWGKLWGGSITENIVQAVARDILAEALLRLQNANYNILLTVHDEIICLFNESSADLWLAGMEGLMAHQPFWAFDLPIAVETKLVKRYEK